MARASTDSARKRTRALHEQEDASLSAKKRRLQASSDLPSAAVKVPSVANGDSKQRGRRAAAAQADSRDVPSSEDKGTTNSAHRQPERLAKGKRQAKKPQPAASTDLQKSSVYDVPDSDEDELTTAAVKPRPRRQTLGTAAAAKNEPGPSVAVNGDEHVKRKRGRPDKVDRGESATAQSSDAAPPEAGAGVSTRRAGRLGARRSPSRDLLQTEERESDGKPVQKLRRPRATTNGRTEDAPMPKGILTPRKGKPDGDRLRRSVVFDDDRGDEETPDERPAETPSRSTRKRSQADEATKTEVQEMDEGPETDQEEDDEVCAICSKPDSAPPNEIVFCDNCDMAVHQECYGLAEIPEGDWICRNCSQDDAPSANSLGPRQPHSAVAARDVQRPDIPNFEQHLRSAQRVLLDRCTGRRRIKLRGQDEAYEKAYQLIEQTVVAGEGNSMMVIGARGCGKTTLIESILADMSRLHEGQFHVVRLSGFIHTDDKLALREIWRQLGKEMEVEDELVNKTTNYADIMASLLALLSHPSEIAETQDGVTSRSIIFVIDEFDLFATHARQTLLYNLFDIAQARKAPIAVLGLTTRIDVVESLEKRVKSRFSHRYVHLSLPKSLPAYWDICKQGLTVDEEDMVLEGLNPSLEGHSAFWAWWNGKIEALYKTQEFADHLESHFYTTKSVSAFLTTCIMPLAALSATAPSLQIPPAAGPAVSLEPPDSKLHLLGSLSDLDLAMLIAAARLDIVAHTDTVNFAMAYDEYTSLMGRQRVQSASSGMLALGGGARVWGRGAAGIAWERLVALGLLVPAAPGGRGTAGLGGLDAKMWKVDVALEEIPAAAKLNAVLARWCREI